MQNKLRNNKYGRDYYPGLNYIVDLKQYENENKSFEEETDELIKVIEQYKNGKISKEKFERIYNTINFYYEYPEVYEDVKGEV